MLDFTFHNPTRILFGQNRIKDIASEIPAGSHVMITYGGGSIVKTGVMDEIKTALKGFTVSEFGGIEPNPTYETLMQCVARVKAEKVDFILAAGGGSVIDGTKFIAAAALYEGEPWDILETYGARVTKAVPFGTVLTLPATGSEMNCGAVITRKEFQAKLVFSHPSVFPTFSVLDPTKSFTLPERQLANGVVDAFVHVMEQYLTFPVQGGVQDRFSEGLLLTLLEEGPKALKDPEDYDVRANIMWVATLALNGLIGAGVPQDWATHMVGHELTALYGVDHARTLAVVLPAMMEARREEKKEKLLQYASRVWNLSEGSDEARMTEAIAQTRAFFEAMGIPTRLAAYDIGEEAIEKVCAQLTAHGLNKLGEHQSLPPDQVGKILAACL
ncbi:iron-containing alcohol dehydrogenase [Desulfoluna sp.]|uniref:iron-containing alcohol dehydrogenase n=1 Tax=Desulfoluna sp. TaxID=2045199 RepID=UPI002611F286|nr:iron-containing alcohol dehydrogenase [Desulfoluna sp.]